MLDTGVRRPSPACLHRGWAERGRDAPLQGRDGEEEDMEQDSRRATGPQRIGVRTKAATKAGHGGGQGMGRPRKGQGGNPVGLGHEP